MTTSALPQRPAPTTRLLAALARRAHTAVDQPPPDRALHALAPGWVAPGARHGQFYALCTATQHMCGGDDSDPTGSPDLR